MPKRRVSRDRYQGRSIGRRAFVAGTSLIGLGAVAGFAAMPRVARAETAIPKGGHLKAAMGQGSTSDSLDPGKFENGFTIALSYTSHGKLTNIGSDGQLESDLAETWEGSDGAKKWVFTLRDAEFHNGRKVTADDVVASLNHHRGEETTSAAKPILESVTSIKADGEKTVVIELDGGNADFPFTMTDYHLSIGMAGDSGKVDWQDDGSQSGPYKLAAFEPGVKAVYEKAGNHWNSKIGHMDSAELLVVLDPTARQTAVMAKEIDVCERPDTRTVSRLQEIPHLDVEESFGYRFHSYNMLMDTPPFDNNDVRLAFKYGINRQELVDKALSGHGVIANDHPITPAYRYYADNIPQRAYDPDKAKFHLNKAGLSSLDVDLSASSAAYASAVDAAVLYKEHAAKAGMNINVVTEPSDGYWSNVWMKKAFSACDWGGRPTEDQMFSIAYQSGVPWNDTRFSNEKFDNLLIEARSELDEAKRRDMYIEMQMIVHDDGGVIVPMLPSSIWVKNKRVQHADQMSSAWQMDGLQFVSRWWIES